jgi:hypothetical protein
MNILLSCSCFHDEHDDNVRYQTVLAPCVPVNDCSMLATDKCFVLTAG